MKYKESIKKKKNFTSLEKYKKFFANIQKLDTYTLFRKCVAPFIN